MAVAVVKQTQVTDEIESLLRRALALLDREGQTAVAIDVNSALEKLSRVQAKAKTF